MTANELRIGNYVKREAQPFGFKIDAYSFPNIENPKHDYQPIALTEEWLIKFGFKEGIYERFKIHLFKHDKTAYVKFLFLDPTSGENEYKTLCMWNKIKYVHQLQNLYFALTGEELTLKQPQNNLQITKQ